MSIVAATESLDDTCLIASLKTFYEKPAVFPVGDMERRSPIVMCRAAAFPAITVAVSATEYLGSALGTQTTTRRLVFAWHDVSPPCR